MKLHDGIHLAYCTNVHRGETWAETFAALERHVLPVRRRVAPGRSYAIGLRLGQRAARGIGAARHPARVSTVAGGERLLRLHDQRISLRQFSRYAGEGTGVRPDWSTPERVAYTHAAVSLLAQLTPAGASASVSTVPASFKGFVAAEPARRDAIFSNLTTCGRALAALAEKTGRDLHLGLEPEPCCLFETSRETVEFFEAWRATDASVEAESLLGHVGVNYDCCHLAVEFESAADGLDRLVAAGIRLSKLHLSSALRVRPDAAGRKALEAFVEPVYLHQVVVGGVGSHDIRRRFIDLPEALADATPAEPDDEWRIHFHVPLHAAPGAPFQDTRDHLIGALDWLKAHPGTCAHLEMETYTWEVLPPTLRLPIEDQLVREYAWTLDALAARGLADPAVAAHCAREARG